MCAFYGKLGLNPLKAPSGLPTQSVKQDVVPSGARVLPREVDQACARQQRIKCDWLGVAPRLVVVTVVAVIEQWPRAKPSSELDLRRVPHLHGLAMTQLPPAARSPRVLSRAHASRAAGIMKCMRREIGKAWARLSPLLHWSPELLSSKPQVQALYSLRAERRIRSNPAHRVRVVGRLEPHDVARLPPRDTIGSQVG